MKNSKLLNTTPDLMNTSPFGFTKLFSVNALLLASTVAQAVTITVSGTANTTALGYTAGQPVSFSFVTPSTLTTLNGSSFAGNFNAWVEDQTSDNQMFTSISGTDLTGTYVRPTSGLNDPLSYISNATPNYLEVLAGNEGGYGIGLLANSGATTVKSLYVEIDGAGPTFSYPGFFVEPVSVLDAVAGTYNVTGGSLHYARLATFDGNINFTLNELIITPDAAEVPFGVDSTTGLALLGAATAWKLRRRRKTA